MLDVVYAFPGLDGGLAQSCMQVPTYWDVLVEGTVANEGSGRCRMVRSALHVFCCASCRCTHTHMRSKFIDIYFFTY